jgi:aspartyl-tRNA(Asn)/glutamyl-tRNA(Gln) amidotransferase subunit B
MPLKPENLAELVRLSEEGKISKQAAQDLFVEIFRSGESAEALIRRKGLGPSLPREELVALCQKIIAAYPKPVEEYRSGKVNALNALKGPVMKETKGQANPQLIDQIFRELLS